MESHLARWGRPLLFALASCATVVALAEDHGPDIRMTGAPGDQTCVSCHAGTALNAGGGSIAIELPSRNTYTPGVTQRITVRITDSSARRYGFEMSARLVSDLTNGQAGSFAAVDGTTQVMCDSGRAAPCASASVVQFAEHTLAGYRAASNTYQVDWTPPAFGAGNVRIYAAGNAANGNGNNSGDHIYTTSIELTPAAASPKPTISSARGVVNGASFDTAVAGGTWLAITGTNLATTTRAWAAADLVGGKLPTSLDGVSVSINGKAAYVQYISPTQVNVLSPTDSSAGAVQVTVTAAGQTSDAVTATLQAVAPAFFSFDGKFLAATHANGSLAGKEGLFASAPTATTPVKPGETIVLYGTGFGATSPSVADGEVTTAAASLVSAPSITIGGVAAQVVYAGLVPGLARLYQFNVTVPDAVANGDQAVVAQAGGVSSLSTASCCYLTVER